MNDLQTKLLETARIRARHPRRWIDEVAGVLHKSKHAIYKKIQGETCLSLDEAVTLASYYDVQLDPLIRPRDILSFELAEEAGSGRYPPMLSIIQNVLTSVGSGGDTCIWYAGSDLPFIHECLCPELVMFRYYIRQHIMSTAAEARFDPAMAMKDSCLRHQLSHILTQYYRIPTLEIWNHQILDITFGQIKWALQTNVFAQPGDAFVLCDSVERLVIHLEQMAGCGQKSLTNGGITSDFHLLHNEITPVTHTWLLTSKHFNVLHAGFSQPEFLSTRDDYAIERIKDWFKLLGNTSISLSDGSRTQRVAFFSMLRRKLERVRVEIEAMIKLQES